jgi:hypothetical protein
VRRARPGQLAFVAVLLAARAAAADPSEAARAQARAQYQAGLEAARGGRWDEARAAFQSAYDLRPDPLTLMNLAGAQARTGHLVAAANNYRAFLSEATAEPALKYVEAAERALAHVRARVPRLRLGVEGLAPGDEMALDGRPLEAAALGAPIAVDPGRHELAVRRGGAEVARAAVTVAEAETRDLTVRVVAPAERVRAPAAAAAAPAESRSAPPAVPRSALRSPWLWAGVGAAVAAGVAAAFALSRSPGAHRGTLETIVVR